MTGSRDDPSCQIYGAVYPELAEGLEIKKEAFEAKTARSHEETMDNASIASQKFLWKRHGGRC
jgi:hypothetical protein